MDHYPTWGRRDGRTGGPGGGTQVTSFPAVQRQKSSSPGIVRVLAARTVEPFLPKDFHMPMFIRHRLLPPDSAQLRHECRGAYTHAGGILGRRLGRGRDRRWRSDVRSGSVEYSISGEDNKCLLHRWSPERNTVRRVLDAEVKSGTLRLAVQRLGQPQPTKLEICRERDRRSPTAKRAARVAYEAKLKRARSKGTFPDSPSPA